MLRRSRWIWQRKSLKWQRRIGVGRIFERKRLTRRRFEAVCRRVAGRHESRDGGLRDGALLGPPLCRAWGHGLRLRGSDHAVTHVVSGIHSPRPLEWVEFKMPRLLGPTGDVPPAEFKAQHYEQAKVA